MSGMEKSSPPPNTETREVKTTRTIAEAAIPWLHANGEEALRLATEAAGKGHFSQQAEYLDERDALRTLAAQLSSAQPETKEPRYTLEEIRERLSSDEAQEAATHALDVSENERMADLMKSIRPGEATGVIRRTGPARATVDAALAAAFTRPQHPDKEGPGLGLNMRKRGPEEGWTRDCETREAVPGEALKLAREGYRHARNTGDPRRIEAGLRAALPALEAAWRKRLEEPLRQALEQAADDLGKAVNQFQGLGAERNVEIFKAKELAVRATLKEVAG